MLAQHQPDEAIGEILKAKQSRTDSEAVCACVVAAFGGAEGIAKHLFTLYGELPEKSPSRERILSNIMRLVAQTGSPQGEVPTEEEDVEDLRAVLQEVADGGD